MKQSGGARFGEELLSFGDSLRNDVDNRPVDKQGRRKSVIERGVGRIDGGEVPQIAAASVSGKGDVVCRDASLNFQRNQMMRVPKLRSPRI